MSEPWAAYDPLGHLAVPDPPEPGGPPQPTSAGSYAPSYWGSVSTFSNANNYSTGCFSATNNPASCSDIMRRQTMSAWFMGNLPGAHDDMWWGEQRYAYWATRGYWPGSAGEYWGWGESSRIPQGARSLTGAQNPKPTDAQRLGIRPKLLEDTKKAINECLGEKWGYVLRGLDPVSKGRSGSMTVNSAIDELEGSAPPFQIFTDVTSYSGSALAKIHNDLHRTNHVYLMGFGPKRTPQVGESGKIYNHPLRTNFLANDMRESDRTSDPRLSNLLGNHLAIQIHESGNTMEGITNKHIGIRGPRRDGDSGMVFEECVYSKLVAMGHK